MNYKLFQTINFLSAQLPLYLMLMISVSSEPILEGIAAFQLIIGLISLLILKNKIKSKNMALVKTEKVELRRAKVSLLSAVYPIFIPILFVINSKNNLITGFIMAIMIQMLVYLITINSSDWMYNYSIILFGRYEVFEGKINNENCYCFVHLQRDIPNGMNTEVRITNKLTTSWYSAS